MAFSPAGTLLTGGHMPLEDCCRVLDVSRGTELGRVAFPTNPREPTTMAVSPRARLIAVAEPENVRLFDPASAKEKLHIKVTGLIGDLRVAFSPDGRRGRRPAVMGGGERERAAALPGA
jgi:hypothetical protein